MTPRAGSHRQGGIVAKDYDPTPVGFLWGGLLGLEDVAVPDCLKVEHRVLELGWVCAVWERG